MTAISDAFLKINDNTKEVPKTMFYLLYLMNSIAEHKQPTALDIFLQISRNTIFERIMLNKM